MTRKEFRRMTSAQLAGRQVRVTTRIDTCGGLTAFSGTILTIRSKYLGRGGGLHLSGPGFSISNARPESIELLPIEAEAL